MRKLVTLLVRIARGTPPTEREMTQQEANTEYREYQVQKSTQRANQAIDKGSEYLKRAHEAERGYSH